MKVYRRGGCRTHPLASCLLGVSLLFAFVVATAAGSASPAGASGGGREKLPGHQGLVPPGATLVGPAPATATLPLTVTLKPRDPAGLSALAQQVSDPKSPQYRHFLTPVQIAQEFGPTRSTIARVTSSLQQEGLTVGRPAATGLSLPVSGTVAQVQSAFSTPIAKYRLSSGKTGYDNAAAPQVDESVAPQIEGILGLDTLSPPQPSTSIPQASSAAAPAQASPATPTLAPEQPNPTGASCNSGNSSVANVESLTGALDAPDLAQAYSFDPLYSAGDYGAGSTIALLEMSGAGYSTSDISTFANCYGITLGNGQIKKVSVGGGTGTGAGTAETELDIETALSLAPKATIEVYEGGLSDSLYNVFSQIVNDDTAKIVSASWTNGCEAYVGQSLQNSENTLFQTAAAEGQSIFVASGDQGAQGCNVNQEIEATTGTDPVAQAVDPSSGTLYVANKSSNTVSVDSEGTTNNPTNFTTAGSVSTGTGPDAVALDSADGKVFVANSNSTLTVIPTNTCNQTATTGCGSPTQVASNGHLNAPTALALDGSTLYVANGNGSVAVYNAATNAFVATVTLPSSSVPSAVAVDTSANGFVFIADGANGRIEYFTASTCNATTTTGCTATPAATAVGNDPVALVVASGAGDLYVANAGTGGGISVVSLSSGAVVKTIATSQPSNGTGLVQSIGMSPDNSEVLAVLNGLSFPGDVMATISTSSEAITSTVALETGTDAMGQLVSDGTRGYTWVTDETNGGDVIQNLNLAVSDPASQPDVTAVGGTSLGHGTQTRNLGPAPTEQAWNDALYYSEGAGGGGISQTFAMPAYQQPLGTVSGSTGTPCANAGGDCREVPDVSADADPSSGYIIYDTVNGLGWNALGGTSGAAPLWAAVVAVVASANGNTAGYGQLNPALYLLAQQSPGTFLNDVTSGNNDYNATAGGQYPALTGYDMATGLGTPVASALASGLTAIPLTVVVSGTMPYGGSPSFSATANYAGSGSPPFGVTLDTSGLSCSTVGSSTPISPSLAIGQYTLLASSCSGLTLGGADGADYAVVYTSAANDFTVGPGPLNVAVSGSQMYGGTPTFAGSANPPSGVTVSTSGLTCTQVGTTTIAPTLPAGSYALTTASCSGATLSGPNSSSYTLAYTSVAGDFVVTPAPLTITASGGSMAYGGSPPSITPGYAGFVNSENVSSLTTRASCSTAATSSSSVANSPYASTCSGAVDPNYAFSYVAGSVAVTAVPLTITASSRTVSYGTVPTITAGYAGFVNGESASSLTTKPTCSTTDTGSSSSPVSGSPYASSCIGAVDTNYTIGYVAGSVTVTAAPLVITASSSTTAYGQSPPAVSPIYHGLTGGDTASALSPQPTCTTAATNTSPVSQSPYTTSCSGAADPNYTISYVNGIATVTPQPIPVAVSGSQANGGAPSFQGSYGSPLPSGVTLNTSGLTCSQVTPAIAISADLQSGGYTLAPGSCGGAVVGGANGGNYAVSYTSTVGRLHRDRGPGHTHAAADSHVRLLARGLRRRHLHVRFRTVLRVDRQSQAAATGRRHQPHGGQSRILVGGVGRGHLRLRQRRLLRLHTRRGAGARRIGPAAQPQCADRRHGAVR